LTPSTCDADWLAARRWYGASDRTIRSLRVVDAEALGEGLSWQVVEVDFAAGAGPAERAYFQLFWDEAAGEDVAQHPRAMAGCSPTSSASRGRRGRPARR
jgi:hypothetical protein